LGKGKVKINQGRAANLLELTPVFMTGVFTFFPAAGYHFSRE